MVGAGERVQATGGDPGPGCAGRCSGDFFFFFVCVCVCVCVCVRACGWVGGVGGGGGARALWVFKSAEVAGEVLLLSLFVTPPSLFRCIGFSLLTQSYL